jgi:serine/threonine protein phosphatase PrpC
MQASDGIWDRITTHDAVRMVFEAKNVEEACRRLCDVANFRWLDQCESVDDITCVVIELDCGDQALVPVSSSSTSSSPS